MFTVVLTSCNRHDLLRKTLESLSTYIDSHPIKTIIIEDGEVPKPHWLAEQNFPNLGNIEWIQNDPHMGQVKSLDKAYELVTTPFIFSCEDDWEFYKTGFIESSLKILEKYPNILQVWIREQDDTNGHPVVKLPQFDCKTMQNPWGIWGGFSWNPGLRRLSDYKALGQPYSHFGQEHLVSKAYSDMGFHAAITPKGFVHHTGWTRGLPKH